MISSKKEICHSNFPIICRKYTTVHTKTTKNIWLTDHQMSSVANMSISISYFPCSGGLKFGGISMEDGYDKSLIVKVM